MFLFQSDYNFSHRIDKFSFGNPHGGIVQPLEGDEKIAEKSKFRKERKKEIIGINGVLLR